MSDHVSNTNLEAYHLMAEILVTLRRIVLRGLEKTAGKTWYVDGCPKEVFDRLVARKENEAAIDRFDRDYQELISFASLDDLADIIDYNWDLAHLLEGIAPERETIVERFRQLETLRLKLDATVPLSEEDVENLLEYHKEFRQSLERPKKKKQEPPEGLGPAAEAAGESAVEEPEELGADDVVPDGPSDANEAADVDSGVDQVSTEADSPDDAAVEAQRAIASDDDREVLRVLHGEIMSVAESLLEGDVDQEFPVWNSLADGGWFEAKSGPLALGPVERFYAIADAIRTLKEERVPEAEVTAFVAESEVGKLLLSLAEMFRRHEL